MEKKYLQRFFASRGGLVFGHDHFGHGRTSGGRVTTVGNFHESYVKPAIDHCKTRKAAFPGKNK